MHTLVYLTHETN
ncbi:hypothetical protein FOVSG1_003967 [Fusarium oxysporum f. sp. vasinfectum]